MSETTQAAGIIQMPAAITERTPQQQAAYEEMRPTLANVLNKAVDLYPAIKESCDKAVIALSKVQSITNDEQDEYAKQLLVKVRKTFEEKSTLRLEITRPLDSLKELLMSPEKTISTDAKVKESQYNRVKLLRDGWAAEKKKKADEEREKIKKQQDTSNEKARIKAELERAITNGLFLSIQNVSNWCATTWGLLTLENIDEMDGKLSGSPSLKMETYQSWANVSYNGLMVTAEEYKQIVSDVLFANAYQDKNKEFSEKVAAILAEWKSKIPARRKELQDFKKLAEENAAEAERLRQEAAENAKKLADKQAEELQQQQQTQNAAIDQSEQDAQMNAAFSAQVAEQSISHQDGTKITKIGTLSCPEEDVVTVICEVFYHCMIHPKYKGIIKRDKKTGELQHDDNGRPIYIDWVEDLFAFYANNCDPQVKGITISEKVGTIQKL